MLGKRPSWFWAVTASFILMWAFSGTLAIIQLFKGNVYIGEAVIIVSTIVLVVFYYIVEHFLDKR
ncbi:MAG: hypothetical protein V1818_01655 [Candidatus Aenigmatarchaeota archaeon]